MAVTFLFASMWKNLPYFGFHFAQLTDPFCSKLDISFLPFHFWFWIICHSTSLFSVIFNIFVIILFLDDGMLCVYKGNDKKKSLQTWILKKEIRHEAEKEFEHLFSSLSNTLFCLFWNWDLKTRVSYDVEMQCLYRTMSLSRLLHEFRPIK